MNGAANVRGGAPARPRAPSKAARGISAGRPRTSCRAILNIAIHQQKEQNQ